MNLMCALSCVSHLSVSCRSISTDSYSGWTGVVPMTAAVSSTITTTIIITTIIIVTITAIILMTIMITIIITTITVTAITIIGYSPVVRTFRVISTG